MSETQKGISNEEVIRIARGCGRFLAEKKARDIRVIDLRRVNSYLDYFIIMTGNSHVHCKSLVKETRNYMHEQGLREHGKNAVSMDTNWIILDFNHIIVHIFMEEARNYYSLENLWADGDNISLDDK